MISEIFKEYFAEFQDEIDKMLSDPNQPEKFVKTSFSYNFSDFDKEELAFDKIEKTMAVYFFFENGFLGRDIYQLKQVMMEILYILKYLDCKGLSESDKSFLENRITVSFYFLLNCVYNIKEKILAFVSLKIDKKKFDFSKSILSETGKKEVRKALIVSYKKIEKYILTRNIIVHDTYDMRYVNEEQKIEIRCFPFNLSKGNDLKKETYHEFVISKSEIKNLLVSIYSLRKDMYFVLRNRDNIEISSLLEKFTYSENGKSIFRITH